MKLTERQNQVMTLLISGYNRKEIASKMNVTKKTVDDHASEVRKRLKARTMYHAIAIVVKNAA